MVDVPESAVHTATIPGVNRVWEKILNYGLREGHTKGEYIFPYEKGRRDFYYLARGSLTILHDAPNGQVKNMLYMRAGTLINVAHALGSSLTSFLDAGCRFYCLTDVELWRFSASLLADEAFIRAHPDLIANLMESLGLKLLMMHNVLANTGTGDAVTRLCRFCVNMSQANNGATELFPDIALVELANLLGIHRISLFRAVRKLKEMKVISELSRERLVIQDSELLKKLARG